MQVSQDNWRQFLDVGHLHTYLKQKSSVKDICVKIIVRLFIRLKQISV